MHKDAEGVKYIVLEYIPQGTVLDLLRKKRTYLTIMHLVSMAIGVAKVSIYVLKLNSKFIREWNISKQLSLSTVRYSMRVSPLISFRGFSCAKYIGSGSRRQICC